MSKHTSGPWEAYHSVGAGWNVRKQHEREGYNGLAPICSMAWFQFTIPEIIDDQISEANARLIAAAPELLEACREALTFVGPMDSFVGCDSTTSRILRAAIAKATGQA